MSELRLSDLQRPDAEDSGNMNPCILCGKETTNKQFVRLTVFGMLTTVEPTEDEDQGYYPVGPECAKRIPVEFVTTMLGLAK